MALATYLRIMTRDAQKTKNTLEFRIVGAAYGDTTLPTAAKIKAVVNAIFGNAKFSDQHVTGWEVALVESDNTGAAGGNAGVATATALRVRNLNTGINPFMFSVPGLMKNNVIFDPNNRSSVSTSGALWDALRAALTDAEIAIETPSGAPVDSAAIAETAQAYNGKRKAPQPH